MKHFGVFSTNSDIQNAIDNKLIVNPYVAIYNNNISVDYNTKRKIYTFGGYEIAPGPLVYRNSSFDIDTNAFVGPGSEDGWQDNDWTLTYGLNEGSYWFSYNDLNINSFISPIDNFYIPTINDLETIFGSSRPGSTVGEFTGVRYAIRLFSGNVNRADEGILIFPDNETFQNYNNGISKINKTQIGYSNWVYNLDELKYYISNGCVFLPLYNYQQQWVKTGVIQSSTLVSGNTRSMVVGNYGISASSMSVSGTYGMVILVRSTLIS